MEVKCETKGHTYMQWILALIANLSTLANGMELGWISPMTKILQSNSSPIGYGLSDTEISWVASSTSFAAGFGVLIYSYFADKFGRKLAVIALSIPQAFSLILRIFCPTLIALSIARIISGLVAGGCCVIVPIYVKEISQNNICGTLLTLQVLIQNLGIFLMYAIGIYLDYYTVLWIITVLPVLSLITLLFAPESPAFLVKQEKIDEAYRVVALLRGLKCDDKNVENEIKFFQQQESEYKSMPEINLKTIIYDNSWRHGIILTVILFTIQAWNGAYAIITYATSILSATGVEFDIAPEYQTLSFPIVMILACLLLTLLVEQLGRKILLTVSFLISAMALSTLSISMIIRNFGGSVPSFLPVVAMMLSVAMFSGCICPVSNIVTIEFFNFQVRGKIMGLVLSYSWIIFFIPLIVYAPLTNMFGQDMSFLFFGVMNSLGALFTIFFIPETKGRSDEDIRNVLSRRKKGNSA